MGASGAELLVVCTANRCRSPLAAALFDARAHAAGLSWRVESAGTRVRRGEFTEPEVVEVLGEWGISSPAREVRRLDVPAMRRADLILTAERRHRSAVLEEAPEKVGRTFTLLEFERLLRAAGPGATPQDFAQLAALADSARAAAGLAGPGDDLADPINAPIEAFRQCRARVLGVVDTVVTAMTRERGALAAPGDAR